VVDKSAEAGFTIAERLFGALAIMNVRKDSIPLGNISVCLA
jgi:hypothetical protein